jgi:hypothetical protein
VGKSWSWRSFLASKIPTETSQDFRKANSFLFTPEEQSERMAGLDALLRSRRALECAQAIGENKAKIRRI